MSVTLAIDAAGDAGSVAALRAGSPLALARFGHRRHAAELAPAIHQVLHQIGATPAEVTRLIVSDGPGSFTGLRIGFATALGLVHGRTDVETWVSPSLLATAWAARDAAGGAPIAALHDALRGDVYGAIYRCGADRVEVVVTPRCATVSALATETSNPPAFAVGDGAERYADDVRRWTGRAPVTPAAERVGAPALVELLAVPGGATRVADLATHEPNYGRLAEAQARWERARGRPLPHS